MISPDLRTAPFTCLDSQHPGRWPAPHPRIVAYVRAITNPSLRELMALYALIKAGLGDVTFYARLRGFAVPLRTKDVLIEIIRFLRARLGVKKLPIVSHPTPKCAPDRYVLQWNGKALGCAALNTALRFLLHDVVRTPEGKTIHLTTHLLRHGFATEMASLHVPADIVARLLHQRHVEITQYYARPTNQQVVEAAELLFVDRIDVAAEAFRHPKEIGKLLRDAQGQIGALSEVLGGTCVVGNMCPAKFACIGCAGNAPDPDRRGQIETKRRWAEQQIRWTTKEGLYAEQRQMTQLVRDCDVALQEMDLVAAARKDDQLAIIVNHRSSDGPTPRR